MNLEKERLKLALMGYNVKTVRSIGDGSWFSIVKTLDNKTTDPSLFSTPFPTEQESIEHAIKSFFRFHHLMKKHYDK